MLRWLRRLFDQTPEISDDLPIQPPAPPPDDLSSTDLLRVPTYLPDRRTARVTRETDETRSLTETTFQYFRANPDELPAFPALALQIIEVLQTPDEQINVQEVVRLLSREPATSALILRVANSSRFGGANRIETIRDAVVRLGVREVATIAMAAASRTLFDIDERSRAMAFNELWANQWRHALTTAFSASWLAMESGHAAPQAAFLAGLLHDTGKALALRAIGEQVADGSAPMPNAATVEFVLQETHVDLGAEATLRWGLPDFVMEVCQDHHLADEPGLPLVIQLASDVYELKYNPLHRASLTDDLLAAAYVLGVDQRRFRALVAQVATAASMADSMAIRTA